MCELAKHPAALRFADGYESVWRIGRTVIAAAVCVVLLMFGMLQASASPTLLGGAQDPVLVGALYSNPYHLSGMEHPDGSVSSNYAWEMGAANQWYIEYQRFGGDLIQGGIVNGDSTLVGRGWNQLNWGFDFVQYDFGLGVWSYGLAGATGYPFQQTSNPFHSTSLEQEATARAILLCQQAGLWYDPIDLYAQQGVALWMTQPSVESPGAARDSLFTHRRWIVAAGLSMTAATTLDPILQNRFMTHAATFAGMGLGAQWPNGVNPEVGGYDVSYQAVGLLDAERAYTVWPSGPGKTAILASIVNGLNWELTRIDSDSNVVLDGSTRVGIETNADGSVKIMDYKSLIEALTYGTYLTGDPRYEAAALAVSRNILWLPYTNMLANFEGASLSEPFWTIPPGVAMAIDPSDRPVEENGDKSAYAADIVFQGSGAAQDDTLSIYGSTWSTSGAAGGLGIWLKADLRDAAGNSIPLSAGQLAIQLRENQSKTILSKVGEKWIAYIGDRVNPSSWVHIKLPFSSFQYNGGTINDGKITFNTLNQLNIEANIPTGDTLLLHVDKLQVYSILDMTAPTTQTSMAGSAGNNGIYTSPVAVTLTATDADGPADVAATYYTVDGATRQTYSSPFTVVGDGLHNITFWSVDRFGNIETAQTASITVDSTAPATAISLSGPGPVGNWYSGPVAFTLTSADATSGVQSTFYAIDASPAQTYAGPVTVTGDGVHTIAYWSVDSAGNVESAQTTTVYIEGTTPVTTLSLSGHTSDSGTYNTPVSVTLSAAAGPSGIAGTYVGVDGGPAQPYVSPFTLATDGSHTVAYWSVSNAGVIENANTSQLTVDITAPATSSVVSGNLLPNGHYSGPVKVSLIGVDSVSGVRRTYFTVDNGPASVYTGGVGVSGVGSHKVTYWSMDNAANREKTRALWLVIE